MKTQSWLWWVVVLAFVLAWLFLDQTWLTALRVNAERLVLARQVMTQPAAASATTAYSPIMFQQTTGYRSQADSTIGWLLAARGANAAAVPALQSAIHQTPRTVDYWMLGEIYFRLGDPQAGLESWEIAFGPDPTMRVHLGKWLYRRGFGELALEELDALLNEDAISADLRLQAFEWMAEATDWRDPVRTAQYARAILILDPKRATAHTRLAFALMRQGKYDAAIGEAKKAIELGDSRADPYEALGASYLGLGQYQQAVQPLETSVRLNPGVLWANYDLGQAYCGVGQQDKAMGKFETVLKIDPTFALARQALDAIGGCGAK